MSIDNQDKLKIQQNDRNYIIIISIEEDQLSLVLNLLSNPPKKYSGFFSLNELRISSKIFNHTETLFEAKEIIKRTVIKKQLLIEENEHRANLTFDPGLGHDSVPFPITLFRDSTEKHPFSPLDSSNIDRPKDNPRNSNIKKTNKMRNIKNNNNNNILNQQNNTYDTQSKITNNTLLRASIGNNVNNQMLFQNNNINNNIQNIQNEKLKNIEFNNSVKRFNNKNINNRYSNSLNSNNINSQKNIFNENKEAYKKVDLESNFSNVNNAKGNSKDYIALNNNILYKIYNNMNNTNNINSSFYRNLQNSFTHTNFNNENLKYVQNNINNNKYINDMRQNIKNIDNNSMNQPILQQNKNFSKNAILKNLNNQQITSNSNNNNIPTIINNMKNNNNNALLNVNSIQNKNNIQNKQIQPQSNQKINNNYLVNPAIITENPSFNTAPVPRNITKIPNMDNNDFQKSLKLESYKHRTFNKPEKNNDIEKMSSSSSEDENDDEDISEENNKGEQPYRFKNLLIKGPKKIKGNLEKFKKNQNMGDYVPAGTKFVSYLKFPSTKVNVNQSMTASTISSSLTSGSNRVIGIEKNIIKNPGELDEITTRIQRILKKRNIKYKLLYRATYDGDFSSKFHEKCDNIPNTLVLIETSGDRRFGGFTTQTWDGDDVNKKDNNCFIFSIDNMKTYDINENQFAINCNPDLGPVFVNQIKLLDKFFIQGGSTNKKGKTFSTLEDFEITGGAEKFGVREVEVYQAK